MRNLIRLLLSLCIMAASATVFAQNAATQAELKAAVQEANAALVHGPSSIKIFDEATFALPASSGFVPAAAATRYLRALGNNVDQQSLIGLVVPMKTDANWFAIVSFVKAGYIRDDDARDWKPDDMLKGLREGTEQSNAGRKERGLPELEVTGWAEVPAYDARTHRLVWSAIVRKKGDGDDAQPAVNYRTLALGRNGYLSLTMVTPLASLAADKPTANALLADIDYQDGKRYADFNASTDHVAEYGLAALIAGVAAKKLGLLAIIAAFAAKFFKVGLIALVAFGASIKRFFRRKPKTVPPVTFHSEPTDPAVEPGQQAVPRAIGEVPPGGGDNGRP